MANETLVGLTRNDQIFATRDASVSNGTTVETDLQTVTIPANLMSSNGDIIEVTASGTYANNTNNKTVALKLGSTTLVTTGAAAQQNGDWIVRATILRTGAATERAVATHATSASSGVTKQTYSAGTEDLTTALTLKVTGTSGTASSDVTQTMMVVRFSPSAVID